ncbi:MAG: ribose-5-phosphate isomerase RpiA [Spirochaetales bacterium]|nr:ribose-5-phosphate isomerase RpiA [Spirochaetales bacterium]
MEMQEIKARVGQEAVKQLVRDGMKLGLGTGSTAIEVVRTIRQERSKGNLQNIKIVATSFQTDLECRQNGIPVYNLNDAAINGCLDLTIDGADEVDPDWNLIKGGGGAHFIEKITAYFSHKFAIVIDYTKKVDILGQSFPIPVEVFPQAYLPISKKLEKFGANTEIRMAKRMAGPVITYNGNFILDISFKEPFNPEEMEKRINSIPGVIENGIFTLKVDHLLTGTETGEVILENL